jgi:thiol-disulfide isomerase/thioredoxin
MKHIILILVLVITGWTAAAQGVDQSGHRIAKGIVTRYELVTDTAFAWFTGNQKGYVPGASVVSELAQQRDSVYIIVFGGTWCDDTHQILPHLFALADAASLPESHITFLAVDKQKKTIGSLAETYNITRVPTILVFKNGKEAGRVTEYGTSGDPLIDIGMILTSK